MLLNYEGRRIEYGNDSHVGLDTDNPSIPVLELKSKVVDHTLAAAATSTISNYFPIVTGKHLRNS